KNVGRVAFSPDGKTLAVQSYDNALQLWSLTSGKELERVDHVCSFAFSPDNRLLAWSNYEVVVLFDLQQCKEAQRWSVEDSIWSHLAFASDGKCIAAASSEGIHVWDTKSGQELRHIDPGDFG